VAADGEEAQGHPEAAVWSRRRVLATAAAAVAAAALAGCSSSDGSEGDGAGSTPPRGDGTAPAMPPFHPVAAFPEGILSGSPLPTAVVLWTRVKAGLDETVDLTAELSRTADFATVVATHTAKAVPERDHCVHIDATGLEPGTWYFYRFRAGGTTSPVGRTRTAPARDAAVESAHVAFFSCQRWTHGWFTSHRHLAEQRDLDLVISLGDYVYNDSHADGITVEGRLDPTPEAVDRQTFRGKYELYRSDPDLQAMHAAAPLVCIPDNHDGRDGPWEDAEFQRGAMSTFFERMPVRRNEQDPERTYGSFAWGRLFELWMLDLRQYRTRIEGDDMVDTAVDDSPWDPTRTTLGPEQKRWLKDTIVASQAAWRIIGSSMMFTPSRIADEDDVATRAQDPDRPLNAGKYINVSQWDGYQAERRELLQHLHDHGITDTIVVSGDMHWFAAGDGQLDVDDPSSPRVYSEFVGGSVTSAAGEKFRGPDGGPVTPGILPVVRQANSQAIRFFDVDRHGHGELRLRTDRVDVDFVSPTTIVEPDAKVEILASFRIPAGGTDMEVTRGAQW
jgi:alkaline phosphatase D